jgi:hypothetical protein
MAEGSLAQLADVLDRVSFVEGTEASAGFERLLDRARRLLHVKLLFEAKRGEGAPPVVVIAGGTNVGKSTIFNWVVGGSVASSSPLARHTKAPTVFCHEADLGELRNGAFLPRYERLTLETPNDAARELEGDGAYFLSAHTCDDVRGVVLVDSPDIDSTNLRNHAVADDLLYLADAVVFVATPEKYNDELCVSYLRQVAELGKQLTCVLNKGADEEVAADFSRSVVDALGVKATVLTLPYVATGPDPETGEGYREELKQAVRRPTDESARVRAAALSAAARVLARDLDDVSARLREELSELDRVRSELELTLDARRDEYVRFLTDLEFYELDQVFERVLKEFRIPVLDDVYDGMRSVFGFVTSSVSKLTSSAKPDEGQRATKLAARAEIERQRLKELVELARAEIGELPEQHTGTLREAAAAWLRGVASSDVERLNADVDAFLTKANAESERWIEDQTRRHVELLKEHPWARNGLRAIKGVFQVGFGLLSAKLTGGFGPWDVLVGTATERATKQLLESVGGYVHYQTLRSEFAQKRGELLRELLEESIAQPLREALPEGSEPECLEQLARVAAQLRRGEVA